MQNNCIYIIALLFIYACKQQSVLEDVLDATPSKLSMQEAASIDSGLVALKYETIDKVEEDNIVVGTFLGNDANRCTLIVISA